MSLIDDIRAKVAGVGADALLVSVPENVRYVSGFTSPDDGVVLITRERAVLVTDGRYDVQAHDEATVEVDIASGWQERVVELLDGARLAVEAEHVTLKTAQELERRLGAAPIATDGLLTPLRLVKTEGEIACLREAARITDEAFTHILGFLRAGVTEVEVALELERVMRLAGAEAAGYGIIVASGPRSAMPHGVASRRTIESGDLVTLDFGAVYRGYHADMTRAVAVGEISPRLRGLFDAVATAQLAALEAVAPGKTGRELDSIARNVLAEHGLAEAFTHSLGHGTGLHIHEGPRLSQRSDDVLAPGMSATIEPGVYLAGVGGVRIEDLVIVTDDGFELLSKSSKAFVSV